VVSSAPQIRYPDCYGIDMAKLEGLVAFRAALELLKNAIYTILLMRCMLNANHKKTLRTVK
jgi:amidophosphoribosyltransferase